MADPPRLGDRISAAAAGDEARLFVVLRTLRSSFVCLMLVAVRRALTALCMSSRNVARPRSNVLT